MDWGSKEDAVTSGRDQWPCGALGLCSAPPRPSAGLLTWTPFLYCFQVTFLCFLFTVCPEGATYNQQLSDYQPRDVLRLKMALGHTCENSHCQLRSEWVSTWTPPS